MFETFIDKKYAKDFTFNNSFSLLDIYAFIDENISSIKEALSNNNHYKNEAYQFTISQIDGNLITLNICGKNDQIIYPSSKIKFLVNGEYIEYELISIFQFYKLPKELKFQNPEIIYVNANKILQNPYEFFSYINLYNRGYNNIYINEKNYIKIMSEEDFNKSNKKSEFLNKTFANPEEFDKNYYKYFPKDLRIQYDSFHIFENESRKKLAYDFLKFNCGVITKYFGKPSMGKSITLIGSLKYLAPHEAIGTMYINCKALDYYFKNDIITAKQILIDEMKNLFINEYDNYKKCSECIEKYIVNSENIKENFWSLIEIIINLIKNLRTKLYIISFDQYKEEIDKSKKLEEIFNIIRVNNSTISLITLSSLNNDDIAEYKLNSLFQDLISNNNNYVIYKEIKDLIEDKELKIKDKEIDNKLNYLGRTIHNFNIFTYLIKQKNNIDDYIEERRNHIKNRIYDFFDIRKNIKLTDTENLYKFLSFSVYNKYSFNEFKKIIRNIPIKYFEINKKKSKKYILLLFLEKILVQ